MQSGEAAIPELAEQIEKTSRLVLMSGIVVFVTSPIIVILAAKLLF